MAKFSSNDYKIHSSTRYRGVVQYTTSATTQNYSIEKHYLVNGDGGTLPYCE